MLTVSIIIPVYNEEKTVLTLLERVNQQTIDGVSFEIIVVDDGSKDSTRSLLDGRPDLYTSLIALAKNGGKGAAVKAGLKAAGSEYILFQDADLEYDPAEYRKLLAPVNLHDADIVMGSRFAAPQINRVAYFWNKVGNRLITLVFNILNNTTFTDIYSCYLLYRKKLVDPDQLRTEGWEQQAEILTRAVKTADTIYEVPIDYHGRTKAEGKKIRAHHAIAVFWTLFLTRLIR